MEDLLTNAFNTGDIKIVIAALVVYAIVYLQRRDTKKTRDNENDNLKAEIAVLKNELENLKRLDLDARLAAIETSLEYIKHMLESRK